MTQQLGDPTGRPVSTAAESAAASADPAASAGVDDARADDTRGDDAGVGRRRTSGIAYGLAAYGAWGLVPLFWPLVGPVPSTEVLAHRIVWSLVFAAIGWGVLFWRRRVPREDLAQLRRPRVLGLIAVGSALIAVNWGVYIWAVQHQHVVEAALGYYINPILSIAVGVIVLRERLARAQWIAVGLAVVAVGVMTIAYGSPPWVSLMLATSFATYGVVKNRLRIGAITSLLVESAILAPLALGYLAWVATHGGTAFGPQNPFGSVMLVLAGPVTLIPLLWFTSAARRLPLSTLGLLQYVAPTLQFGLGVLWFGERMPVARWVGFGLVWSALIVLTVHGWRGLHQRRRAGRVAQVTTDDPFPAEPQRLAHTSEGKRSSRP